jgi:segregation and condensation protein B
MTFSDLCGTPAFLLLLHATLKCAFPGRMAFVTSVVTPAPPSSVLPDAYVSVPEAARLLGRDRTRVYALIRSGDLVAVQPDQDEASGPLRIDCASLDRWLVAGGGQGAPLSARNAWAVVGLASGDQVLLAQCLGLLERPEDISRARSRLARQGLFSLAPRLRRRASPLVLRLPPPLAAALENDASLVRTGRSAARPYGWTELNPSAGQGWRLDAYLPLEVFSELQRHADRSAAAAGTDSETDLVPVLLRVVDGPWPFPPNYQLAPQPLAALDLLEYPEPAAQRIGREVLRALADAKPVVLARRSARARVLASPRIGRLLGDAATRVQEPAAGEGDPRVDTQAAAAHVLGVLWASASRGATVKELRAAIGLTRERLEAAYVYVLAYPLLGLTELRHGDEFQLVTSGQVAASVERHLNAPRAVSLSGAAMQVLTIVAYRQPVSQAGIESVRGTSSDSAIGTLLQRQLIALDEHRLFTTTTAFLKYLGLRDLADLPRLPALETEAGVQG